MSGRRSAPRSCWAPITRSPASASIGRSTSSTPPWRSRASIPTRTASTQRRSFEPLAQVNVESLKEFDYFTFVHFDGEDDKLHQAQAAGRLLRSTTTRACSRFTSRLPLETPVDTHGKPVEVDVYDPSFFVAFGFATEKPVTLAGAETKGCRPRLTPDPETAADTKALTESFFTQLGPNSNFGSQFAQTVTMKCKDSHL